jgi:hypothetical protein
LYQRAITAFGIFISPLTFRLRDTIATRRFEVLCDAVLDITPTPAPKRVRLKRGKPTKETDDDEADFFGDASGGPVNSPPKRRKRSSVGQFSSAKQESVDPASSGGETEANVDRVLQRISKEKKKAAILLETDVFAQPVGPAGEQLPASDFFNSDLYHQIRRDQEEASAGMVTDCEPRKPSILVGLDLANNEDDAMYALEMASAEAKRVISEMGSMSSAI